jgi:Tripartite tricarboxylate transporter family receptor
MMPANDLMGLIAWLKANPDKAVSGHGGNGSLGHVANVLFRNETGTRFQFVPYRGAAPAIQDLVAGQIHMAIVDPVVSMPQVRAGTIKAYGVTAKTGCSPRLTSRRWTRRDCPGSTSRNGMGFGCPRARRRISLPKSMAQPWRPWPTRRCGRGSPTSGRRFFRVTGRPRRGLALFKKPRSRSGGRSSRKLESKLNDWSAGYPINRVPQDNDTLLRCIILSGRESAVGQMRRTPSMPLVCFHQLRTWAK